MVQPRREIIAWPPRTASSGPLIVAGKAHWAGPFWEEPARVDAGPPG